MTPKRVQKNGAAGYPLSCIATNGRSFCKRNPSWQRLFYGFDVQHDVKRRQLSWLYGNSGIRRSFLLLSRFWQDRIHNWFARTMFYGKLQQISNLHRSWFINLRENNMYYGENILTFPIKSQNWCVKRRDALFNRACLGRVSVGHMLTLLAWQEVVALVWVAFMREGIYIAYCNKFTTKRKVPVNGKTLDAFWRHFRSFY